MAEADVPILVIELVPHTDAGDRDQWSGDHDERPLSNLGRAQAEAVCGDLLAGGAVDALYSSAALRCRQTIEPLANATGLKIVTLDDLREDNPADPPGLVATRGIGALEAVHDHHPTGRVVACSHGDLIPAVAGRISALLGHDIRPLQHRGQRYRIEMGGQTTTIQRIDVPDFPRQ